MSHKKNLKELSDQVTAPYQNTILEKINDHCLRMSVMTGEYRWHFHEKTDELFIVLEGALTIEFRDRPTLDLHAGEFATIPAKTIHKTSCTVRTVNLTIEKLGEDTVFVD